MGTGSLVWFILYAITDKYIPQFEMALRGFEVV